MAKIQAVLRLIFTTHKVSEHIAPFLFAAAPVAFVLYRAGLDFTRAG